MYEAHGSDNFASQLTCLRLPNRGLVGWSLSVGPLLVAAFSVVSPRPVPTLGLVDGQCPGFLRVVIHLRTTWVPLRGVLSLRWSYRLYVAVCYPRNGCQDIAHTGIRRPLGCRPLWTEPSLNSFNSRQTLEVSCVRDHLPARRLVFRKQIAG